MQSKIEDISKIIKEQIRNFSSRVKEDEVGYEFEQREEKRRLREAVASLPSREREIIEMRYGLGKRREMTQKEVADSLGISQSYISRLEKRIFKKLKKEMEKTM